MAPMPYKKVSYTPYVRQLKTAYCSLNFYYSCSFFCPTIYLRNASCFSRCEQLLQIIYMDFQLEVIAFTIASCTLAEKAGAHRIELCDNPGEGGTTPSFGFIKAARQ